MSDVLFFKLSEKDMRKITNALHDNYGKLISYTMKTYQRSRGSRGILNYEALGAGDEAAKAAFADLMGNRFVPLKMILQSYRYQRVILTPI